MCVLSIKVSIRKKSGNLFIDTRTSVQGNEDSSKNKEKLITAVYRNSGNQSKRQPCIWLRKRNPKRETATLLVAVQNNTIRTNSEVHTYGCRYCYMDAPHGRWLNGRRKSLTATTQESCEQYWISPGDNTPQSSSYTATNHPSRKLSKSDEPDTRDTAGEVGTSSWVMYSCEPLRMDEQRHEVQLEPTYSSSVPIRDVALRICRKQWTIGRCGERRLEISVLIAWHDDDHDLCINQNSFQRMRRTECFGNLSYKQIT